MFRALLIHPQEALNKRHLVHCVRVMSVGCTRTGVEQFRLNAGASLLGSNILLNTLFSNTLSLRSSHNVSDQPSHPYQTGKIIVLYILIFNFFDNNLEDKMFCTEW
jgi:hypothetical protein